MGSGSNPERNHDQALRIAKEEMAEKHRIAMEQAQDDFEQQIQKAMEVARCEERQIAEAERRELVAEHERSLQLAQAGISSKSCKP